MASNSGGHAKSTSLGAVPGTNPDTARPGVSNCEIYLTKNLEENAQLNLSWADLLDELESDGVVLD